jgi:hypothetical protein
MLFGFGALTYISRAFSVYYVYGSRMAARSQQESKEMDWRVDAQSVEQQVWTRPDLSDTTCNNGLASAVASDFWSGRMSRHR